MFRIKSNLLPRSAFQPPLTPHLPFLTLPGSHIASPSASGTYQDLPASGHFTQAVPSAQVDILQALVMSVNFLILQVLGSISSLQRGHPWPPSLKQHLSLHHLYDNTLIYFLHSTSRYLKLPCLYIFLVIYCLSPSQGFNSPWKQGPCLVLFPTLSSETKQ